MHVSALNSVMTAVCRKAKCKNWCCLRLRQNLAKLERHSNISQANRPVRPFEEYAGTSAIVSTPDARCHKRSKCQRVGGSSGSALGSQWVVHGSGQGELKHGAARHVRLR